MVKGAKSTSKNHKLRRPVESRHNGPTEWEDAGKFIRYADAYHSDINMDQQNWTPSGEDWRSPRREQQPTDAALDAKQRADEILARNRLTESEPVAVTLAFMSPADRRDFLDLYYFGRNPWIVLKSSRATPKELFKWIDETFPDRDELGLVQGDLKDLNGSAYEKLKNWRRPNAGVKLPSKIGFPVKDKRFSTLIAKNMPTGADVYESVKRGDPKAPIISHRFNRGRYHLAKLDHR